MNKDGTLTSEEIAIMYSGGKNKKKIKEKETIDIKSGILPI